MFEHASPEHLEVEELDTLLKYRGRHGGYRRMGAVVHERAFVLARETGVLTIIDRVSGTGTHLLRWHFHLAPGINASSKTNDVVRIDGDCAALQLSPPAGLSYSRGNGWYSPSYGVRLPCVYLDFETKGHVTGRQEYVWRIAPADSA